MRPFRTAECRFHLQSALDEAEKKSKQLALEAEIADNLRHLIDRVQLASGGIRVALNLKKLITEPIDRDGQQHEHGYDTGPTKLMWSRSRGGSRQYLIEIQQSLPAILGRNIDA